LSAEKAGDTSDYRITREKVEGALDAVKPEAVEEAVVKIFTEDGGMAEDIYRAKPDILNAYANFTRAFAESLERLSTEERSGLIAEVVEKLDGEAVGDAANAVSRLLMKVREENPDLARQVLPAIRKAVDTTDFGKLREGASAWMDYAADMVVLTLEDALENPVVMANLIGIAPPLINNLIRIASTALEQVDLPKEVLASALFNTMLAVDREEVGKAISAASRLINNMHEGNLVLGRDEPRFRAVFDELAEGVLEHVDTAELSRAVVSVGEDFEVVLDATTDLLHRDPELMLQASSTVGALLNVALRGIANFLLEFSQLPDEILFRMGEEIRQNLEVSEFARILNLLLMLRNRFINVNPELLREMAAALLPAIDTEQAALLARNVSSVMSDVIRDDPGLSRKFEPEYIGGKVNEAIVAFNRYMSSRDGGPREFMARVFDQMDTVELELAVRNTAGSFYEAFFGSADRAVAVIRPVASGVWFAVKSLAALLIRKVLG
jgi:hypothetical protein